MLQLDIQPALIDQVHDRLLGAIADGTLVSGQRLTQESVAAMLGVSRQPVSHALQVLKRRGFLTEHGKRGLQEHARGGTRQRRARPPHGNSKQSSKHRRTRKGVGPRGSDTNQRRTP
jgi:DNA-binding FadR family transcriptional regulator